MKTMEKVSVDQAALNEMQRRAEGMNDQIIRLLKLLKAGDAERALSLAWLLQEANCKQIHGLIEAGAVDSAAESVGGWSAVQDGGPAPIDVDALDLATIRSEFGPAG